MKKFLFLLFFMSHIALSNDITGLSFITLGEHENSIKKELNKRGAKLLPSSYEEQPHPSIQPIEYENIKLTKNYSLPTIELFFHNKKLGAVLDN